MIKKTFEIFKDNKFEFLINLSFADIVDLDTEGFIIAMLKDILRLQRDVHLNF